MYSGAVLGRPRPKISMVPLLLLDLDDTLLARSAFIRARIKRTLGIDIGPPDLDRLLDMDAGANIARYEVARKLRERYGLAVAAGQIAAAIDDALGGGMGVEPAVRESLILARKKGWLPVIVTNGSILTQELKIRKSGLDRLVAGWVVSEAAGVWKPDPLIFQAAAEQAGMPLASGWMVGDNPSSDIAGAANTGLRSIWLHHGRAWPGELAFTPTGTADNCAAAISRIVTMG
jgi:putative hydrolase of the HAD superfamily